MDETVKAARRALNRLRRAVEKSDRELEALERAIRSAEGEDFPTDEYREARRRMDAIVAFVEEESHRLQQKVLLSGGLEPGRVRRSSTLD